MTRPGCVVLVPTARYIEPECEEGLRQLEALGHEVRRVRGFAAIDQARNLMATSALADGFDELMWVDSDMGFEARDVERLRSFNLPVVCGTYAKKGRRELACNFLPGTKQVLLGQGGGLLELAYAGLGFMLTRREVYDAIRQQLSLPLCNERFGVPLVPYFLPMVIPDGDRHWYLAEDYAFCHRARGCGYRIVADTSIRLSHLGAYPYGWEDAGSDKERYAAYLYHVAR